MIKFDTQETQKIINQVMHDAEVEYEDYLKKRVAINNNRTKEGLLTAISAGVDKFNELDIYTVENLQDYEKKLREQVSRSTYFYINEPLMWRVVRKFDNLPIDEWERFEAAAAGFVIAQNIFDPERGFKFSTLAWHLMSNEIIALNKRRVRQTVIKQPDYEVICRDDCEVISIEKSRDARIVKVKGEVMELFDIMVQEYGKYPHKYRYIYNPPKDIAVGYKFKKGETIGHTAGIEAEISSMEVYMDSDDHGDVIFNNPMAARDEEYYRPDSKISRDSILDVFKDVINNLPPLEQYVVKKRLLPIKPIARSIAAKELGITDAKLAKLEKHIKKILLQELESKELSAVDLSGF